MDVTQGLPTRDTGPDMATMLSRALLFLAVFAPSVLLLNTEMRGPESEAKPLVIAGDGLSGPAIEAPLPTGPR